MCRVVGPRNDNLFMTRPAHIPIQHTKLTFLTTWLNATTTTTHTLTSPRENIERNDDPYICILLPPMLLRLCFFLYLTTQRTHPNKERTKISNAPAFGIVSSLDLCLYLLPYVPYGNGMAHIGRTVLTYLIMVGSARRAFCCPNEKKGFLGLISNWFYFAARLTRY